MATAASNEPIGVLNTKTQHKTILFIMLFSPISSQFCRVKRPVERPVINANVRPANCSGKATDRATGKVTGKVLTHKLFAEQCASPVHCRRSELAHGVTQWHNKESTLLEIGMRPECCHSPNGAQLCNQPNMQSIRNVRFNLETCFNFIKITDENCLISFSLPYRLLIYLLLFSDRRSRGQLFSYRRSSRPIVAHCDLRFQISAGWILIRLLRLPVEARLNRFAWGNRFSQSVVGS